MRLDSSSSFSQTNRKATEASYVVSLEIARQLNPHIISENLVKPCAQKMVGIVLGEKAEAKISAIPLSNNIVHRQISEMSKDIKAQVINEIKSAGLFSLQLDESTDAASSSQLLVFAR